jgi:hypothetical protein
MKRTTFALLVGCAAIWADSAAGLRWTAPAHWKNEGSRPMRAATYAVPAAPGDKEGGECVAYFFGQGQGGSVEANLQRWTGQFKTAAGQPPKPVIKKTTVHGITVTTMDVSGTYTGAGGPMMQAQAPKPGYRMLAAIAEGPGGEVFFKFAAPAKTVAANEKAFDQMIASVQEQ